MFKNRQEAGKLLADRLEKYQGEEVVVLAVPRGGVVVAHETIKRLRCPWSLIIPRKIGSPQNPEVAIGAVSADGTYFVHSEYAKMLGVTERYIDEEVKRQVAEIGRRMRDYGVREQQPEVRGKTVIFIDDGIATGFTILAAIKSVQKQGAGKIILAVPVGPEETIEEFREIADDVVCLHTPDPFYAVGMHYREFEQVEDAEMLALIKEWP